MNEPLVHLPPRTGPATGRRLVHFRTMIVGILVAVAGAFLIGLGVGAQYVDPQTDCREAVSQIVGPAERYDSTTTNRHIARCLDR